MEYLIICVLSLLAGTVQSFTGFGAAAVIMAVLPYYYDIRLAPGICQIICMAQVILMLIRRRRSIRFRQILLPTVLFTACSIAIIHFVPTFDPKILTIVFGVFLIVLSVYSLTQSGDLRIKESLPNTVAVSSVSGVLSGLFGVGGPLIAAYLVSVTDEYEVYLANMQMIFFVSNIFTIGTRAVKGLIPVSVLSLCALGIVFILTGYFCGEYLLNKVSRNYADSKIIVKKTVFVLAGISGVLTILTQIL